VTDTCAGWRVTAFDTEFTLNSPAAAPVCCPVWVSLVWLNLAPLGEVARAPPRVGRWPGRSPGLPWFTPSRGAGGARKALPGSTARLVPLGRELGLSERLSPSCWDTARGRRPKAEQTSTSPPFAFVPPCHRSPPLLICGAGGAVQPLRAGSRGVALLLPVSLCLCVGEGGAARGELGVWDVEGMLPGAVVGFGDREEGPSEPTRPRAGADEAGHPQGEALPCNLGGLNMT